MEVDSKDTEVCFGILSQDLLFKSMDLLSKENVVLCARLKIPF